jgi:hypothetical protein
LFVRIPFTLRSMSTHQLDLEVRLLDSELEVVQTQVCRDQEMLATGERWKAPMLEKGWR